MADPEIESLIAQAGADDCRIVSIVDSIIDKLQKSNLAYRMAIPPQMVGIHPVNRDGYGLSEPEVHALGSEIVATGWSWQACSHAVCIEDDATGKIAAFSMNTKNRTSGLGHAAEGQIRYGSLACTRTNQFLCCIIDSVPCEHENLVRDGRVDTHGLCMKDSQLAKAVEQGLDWMVLKSKVEELYPSLPDLIQTARNGPGQSQRMESEMQILLRIQRSAESMSAQSGGAADWQLLQKGILKRKVPEPDDIPDMIKYVQRWGGGDAGSFIAELNAFHQVFVPSGRVISGATFKAIAELRVGPGELFPIFATALVKTQATCPQNKVNNKVCKFLTQQDIASCEKAKKDEALGAEDILRTFRSLASDMPYHDQVRFFGKLDTTIVRHVLKKPMSEKFDHVHDVARHFVIELEKILDKRIDHPWKTKPAAAASSSSSKSEIVPNFVQFDAAGQAIGAHKLSLVNKGFRDGSNVVHQDGRHAKLEKINEDGSVMVCLQSGSKETRSNVAFDEFLAKYQINKCAVENFDGWMEKAPESNLQYIEAVAKSHIVAAMATLARECAKPKLRIQMKPTRGVFADATICVGKLFLVPETQRIACVPAGSDGPSGGLQCRIAGQGCGKSFFAMPAFSNTFAAAAWAVRVSEKASDANVAISMKKVLIEYNFNKNNRSIEVELPVIVNHSAIKKDTELVLHRPPSQKAKQVKRDTGLDCAVAKKQKA